MTVGRYAPSPSGRLHLGNLRTAVLAWLGVKRAGGSLILRIDDLDEATSRPEHEAGQREDLAALGITFDAEDRQSDHRGLYSDAIKRLETQDLLYPCFCSRREIREAIVAPHEHLADGAYPGTCRDLNSEARARRAAERPAAMRVRAQGETVSFIDLVAGPFSGFVDDFVVSRNDGAPAYNLANVVDDARLGVTQVVRGADLLEGTPRQIWLRRVLGHGEVDHAHVPLMVNVEGDRLAKRDGAVTLPELIEMGFSPVEVLELLVRSVGLGAPEELSCIEQLVADFDFERLDITPTVFDPSDLVSS